MNNESLFIAKMATGLVFCDKEREKDGDYLRLCFLPYGTLKPEWSKAAMSEAIHEEIENEILSMQIRCGNAYPTDASGHTVFLGSEAEGGLAVTSLMKKFPKMTENGNCLEDIACPNCGNRESFKVVMESVFDLFDNGTDDHGDTEWGENSDCQCAECRHSGKVSEFTFSGLDELIAEREEIVGQ